MEAKDFAKVISDVEALIPNAEKLVSDCKLSRNDKVSLIKATKITSRDPATCIEDLMSIIPAIESLVKDMEANDFAKVISDVEALIPNAEKLVSDCKLSRNDKKIS